MTEQYRTADEQMAIVDELVARGWRFELYSYPPTRGWCVLPSAENQVLRMRRGDPRPYHQGAVVAHDLYERGAREMENRDKTPMDMTEQDLAWMRENTDTVQAEFAAHEAIVTVYVREDGARAVCRGGKAVEVTGIAEHPTFDNFDWVPQLGWTAGRLRDAGFVKQ